MSNGPRVHLKVDQYCRIRIKDVISMLKGLRRDTVINIVQESEISDNLREPNIKNESRNHYKKNNSTKDVFKKTLLVKGDTNLPQIRELNEIAALLRSMNMEQQRQISS